ncbi:hypothetical protein [Candidatus Anaplasma sp. TIGMIC]|uniref:hypothetical protein n=1 Tax=Candidatus Anaplasma sp. TIGMIC TaxID=3020713 RepID=UPI0023312AC8|nr:hypothetical protein [Candidatus Anaplasma sp. TIGMIC]MDB1135752.1 hypothetical protein [Candidatus Anaplasma sp. TIGMIC]
MRTELVICVMTIIFGMFAVRIAEAKGCVGLVYAIMDCSAYDCVAKLSGKQVKYEVLGAHNGVCRYSESDETGFTLCNVSKEDFAAVSNYLVQLFTKSGSISYYDTARLRAKTCDFYRVLRNSFIKRGAELDEQRVREIERAMGMRIRREEVEGVKSLFFDDEAMKKLE